MPPVTSPFSTAGSENDTVVSDKDTFGSDNNTVGSDNDAVVSDNDTMVSDNDTVGTDNYTVGTDNDTVDSGDDSVSSENNLGTGESSGAPIETWITNRCGDTPGTVRQLCGVKANLTNICTLSVVPHHTQIVKVTLLNARSACNKALQINEYVCEHECDIVAITETWLRKTGDDLVLLLK